jgi:hypothetical protein
LREACGACKRPGRDHEQRQANGSRVTAHFVPQGSKNERCYFRSCKVGLTAGEPSLDILVSIRFSFDAHHIATLGADKKYSSRHYPLKSARAAFNPSI